MHTLIRDRDISKHDFVFYSDRLIRLVGTGNELCTGLKLLLTTNLNITDFTGSGTWSWLLAVYRKTSHHIYRSV